MVDTNVLVSARLTPAGIPARIIHWALTGELHALFDERIMAEYREVLTRSRFRFSPEEVAAMLDLPAAEGGFPTRVDGSRQSASSVEVRPSKGTMPARQPRRERLRDQLVELVSGVEARAALRDLLQRPAGRMENLGELLTEVAPSSNPRPGGCLLSLDWLDEIRGGRGGGWTC